MQFVRNWEEEMPSLTLTEAKSVCDIAYEGVTGEKYRFHDGSTWEVRSHWATTSTGFKGIVITSPARTDVIVMAFAGTDSLLDVLVDAGQVLGGVPPQYTQALSWSTSQYNETPGHLVLAGHSLGGGLAAYCAVHHGCPAYTVNPAPLVGAATWDAFGDNNHITNFIAPYEFVSRSPGRNPGRDVDVPGAGGMFSVFTNHSLSAVAPSISLPTKL